jgi:hypothetical protein
MMGDVSPTGFREFGIWSGQNIWLLSIATALSLIQFLRPHFPTLSHVHCQHIAIAVLTCIVLHA